MHSGVNWEFDIDECGSQRCLHGAMCQDAPTSMTVYLDSLETTMNSTLMNVPVSYVSMEICVWMEETITTMSTQRVNSEDTL